MIFSSYAFLFKMYKTAVCTLVNSGIAHQKQQVSKKRDIAQHDIA